MNVHVMSMASIAKRHWGLADGVISIRTPNYKGEDQYPEYLNEAIDRHAPAKLVLLFDDAVVGIEPFTKLFTDAHARQILEFVVGKPVLYVHCDAGMSRSVAVGAFLRDCLGANLHLVDARDDSHRNVHVYTTLKRVGGFTPIGA